MIEVIAPLTASQLHRMTRDDPLWNQLENNEIDGGGDRINHDAAAGAAIAQTAAPQ